MQKVNINDIPIVYTNENACQEIYWTDDDNNNMLLVVTLSNNNFIRSEKLYKITESGKKIPKNKIEVSSQSFMVTINSDESKNGLSESMEKIKSYFSDPTV